MVVKVSGHKIDYFGSDGFRRPLQQRRPLRPALVCNLQPPAAVALPTQPLHLLHSHMVMEGAALSRQQRRNLQPCGGISWIPGVQMKRAAAESVVRTAATTTHDPRSPRRMVTAGIAGRNQLIALKNGRIAGIRRAVEKLSMDLYEMSMIDGLIVCPIHLCSPAI